MIIIGSLAAIVIPVLLDQRVRPVGDGGRRVMATPVVDEGIGVALPGG